MDIKCANQHFCHARGVRVKAERAKAMLLYADVKIGEVASALHLSDADYFSKIFKKVTTYTPSAYQYAFLYKEPFRLTCPRTAAARGPALRTRNNRPLR